MDSTIPQATYASKQSSGNCAPCYLFCCRLYAADAAIRALQASFPGVLVPTFLGAHAVPAEYQGREEAYVDLVVDEMLPAVLREAGREPFSAQAQWLGRVPLFCDVFCEEGAFSPGQCRRVLEKNKDIIGPICETLIEYYWYACYT